MSKEVHINWNEVERFNRLLSEKGLLFAELAVAYAKRKSPYLTGHNRSSITVDFYIENRLVKSWAEGSNPVGQIQMALSKGEFGFVIYTQSGYGGYLELGTAKRSAIPYIFPAVESSARQIMSQLGGLV